MTAEPSLPDQLDCRVGSMLVTLARRAITDVSTTDGGSVPETAPEEVVDAPDGMADAPEEITAVLREPRGAFVTLERAEQLRGCCGRIESSEPLWRATATSARTAATEDPRFPPVSETELPELTVSVTVLSEPAPVNSGNPAAIPDHIEVGRDGLLVSDGSSQGVLLPQVPVAHDLDERAFLAATCRKAGLPDDAWQHERIEIRRFTGRAFEERSPRGEVLVRRYDQGVSPSAGHF